MAGRVLRTSNGRFNGSTKGFGKGRSISGSRKAYQNKTVGYKVSKNRQTKQYEVRGVTRKQRTGMSAAAMGPLGAATAIKAHRDVRKSPVIATSATRKGARQEVRQIKRSSKTTATKQIQAAKGRSATQNAKPTTKAAKPKQLQNQNKPKIGMEQAVIRGQIQKPNGKTKIVKQHIVFQTTAADRRNIYNAQKAAMYTGSVTNVAMARAYAVTHAAQKTTNARVVGSRREANRIVKQSRKYEKQQRKAGVTVW